MLVNRKQKGVVILLWISDFSCGFVDKFREFCG